jgi:hypothetical protein
LFHEVIQNCRVQSVNFSTDTQGISYYSAFKVSDTTPTIKTLIGSINPGVENINFTLQNIPVQNAALKTRGKLGQDMTNLVSVSASLITDSNTVLSGILSIGGFGQSISPVTLNFITLSATKKDAYVGTVNAGFYEVADIKLAFPPNPLPSYFNIISTYPSTNVPGDDSEDAIFT